MTNINELYKCDICNNVVEIVHEGADALVCCSEAMQLQEENVPQKENLHFAHIEENGINKKIKFNHPMTQEHHFNFIEVISNNGKYLKRKYLKINEPCEMEFKCDCTDGFMVRILCNKDGVWTTR